MHARSVGNRSCCRAATYNRADRWALRSLRALGAPDDQMRATARRAVLGLLNLLAVKSTFISALVTTLAPKLVNSISQVHSPPICSIRACPQLTERLGRPPDHCKREIRAAQGDGGKGASGSQGVQQTHRVHGQPLQCWHQAGQGQVRQGILLGRPSPPTVYRPQSVSRALCRCFWATTKRMPLR